MEIEKAGPNHCEKGPEIETSGPAKPTNYHPPPWNLTGEGIILVYKFTRQWVEQNTFLDPTQQGQFKGGLGYVMMVNYHQTPVGPYKELLIIPGKFGPHGRQSITRIFVDSQDSTENGRYNWGIPKSTQPMTWQTRGKLDKFTVGEQRDPIFWSETERVGVRFPITTKLLPLRLYQQLSGREYLVNPGGSGWASFARVKELKIQTDTFPDVSRIRHLACFKVNPFHMHFPVPYETGKGCVDPSGLKPNGRVGDREMQRPG